LELVTKEIDTNQVELYLTIKFGEQWVNILNGRVKFGLKGGELKLSLENCAFAEAEEIISDDLHLDISPDYLTYYFTGYKNVVLDSALNQVKLGTINITAQPYFLEASFNLSLANICLTSAEGLWKHDITPNKHGILDRKLALFLLAKCSQPAICFYKISSEDCEPNSAISSEVDYHNLQKMMEKITQANTDNLLELAELAGLNPSDDFAGANFLGTDLSGLDLSGNNLEYINLRGAVLTDVDLSEANLSHAKLSGADLSGAFLENANLSYADLHCASLALVNLIGVNLTGAVLTETNLTNANLSGAILDGVTFGGNQGISEELRSTLLAKGARLKF
jgi:uncharacterized protein YjbI with pentapeptide repeats